MNHVTIFADIDQQEGFSRYDIPQTDGGCLYVPGGEATAEPAARLIDHMKNGVVILSQDFHPDDHIGFMENHPGVIAHRKQRLRAAGHDEALLDALVIDVLTMAFDDILLKESNGKMRAVAFRDGNVWRDVSTDDNGYITAIGDTVASADLVAGALPQTLWRKHCVRGSKSAQLDGALLDALPRPLAALICEDAISSVIGGEDDRGNLYRVIRKGMRADMDSYGIATENDGVSLTEAPRVFADIAQKLAARGVTHADILIGGLATNFCVEFSHNDIHRYLVPALNMRGIKATVTLVSDLCAGIPLAIPGGAWPDLANAPARMAAHGTRTATLDDLLRGAAPTAAPTQPAPNL